METPKPSSSTSPRCSGVSWRSAWDRRLSWLISALSGTLEIEAETERLRKETEQVRSENVRLTKLESKIDGLFSKYDIKLPQGKTPEQP